MSSIFLFCGQHFSRISHSVSQISWRHTSSNELLRPQLIHSCFISLNLPLFPRNSICLVETSTRDVLEQSQANGIEPRGPVFHPAACRAGRASAYGWRMQEQPELVGGRFVTTGTVGFQAFFMDHH